MWDLIVSVPDHCLSFYFSSSDIILVYYINENPEHYSEVSSSDEKH